MSVTGGNIIRYVANLFKCDLGTMIMPRSSAQCERCAKCFFGMFEVEMLEDTFHRPEALWWTFLMISL